MSEAHHCDWTDSLEILKRIPNNPSTMPFRHWVTGEFPSDELGVDDCIEALLWSDHGVAIRAVDDVPPRTYWVNHNGDLQALTENRAIRSPHEAAVMLDGELRTETIDVVAILSEDAPEPARSVGKEIVTDGGTLTDNPIIGYVVGPSDDAVTVCTECAEPDEDTQAIHDSEVYGDQVPYPECWVCQGVMRPETADSDDLVTDGGRPPLRRCPDCGLIHRPTEACRAANGGDD